MALGFGFNKAKVLASAEKYVQQGKLQNAISEYEKVIKEDPKDLTVINTIGDLHARIGNNDKAVEYFKRVGDAYAAEGFTVKAIAMYKKLSKLNSGEMSSVLRLAELYTAQGLYNDARAQYVIVAEGYLKSGRNEDAAKIFQKILELDPDNVAMQTKLADLYMKLGKKNDARNIYLTAAQSLYSKQSMEQADDACARVLSIEGSNPDALLLRGTIAAESGDGSKAVQYLTQIPNYETNAAALRALLRGYLLMSQLDEASPIAIKLIGQFKDLNGLTWYTDALINAGRHAEAFTLYETHADQLIKGNPAGLQRTLIAAISKVKGSSAALGSIRKLLLKVNDRSHDAELMELLAHAYVTDKNFAPARDLYRQLAEAEPENPLHAQNYKQVVAMLGEDAAARPLSAEQGSQAIMMDAIDPHHQAPTIQHDYPEEIAAAVRAALTDSELFESYNLPPKAIAPLEAGLAKAPRDEQLNVRVAALYAKLNRFAEAASAAKIVHEVYTQHGFTDEAQKFAELAAQYTERAGGAPARATSGAQVSIELSPAAADLSAAKAAKASAGGFAASSVASAFPEEAHSSGDELTADAFGDMFGVAPPPAAPAAPKFTAPPPPSVPAPAAVAKSAAAPASAPPAAADDWGTPAAEMSAAAVAPAEFSAPPAAAPPVADFASPAAVPADAGHGEWEDMLVVEHPEAAAAPAQEPAAIEQAAPAFVEPAAPDTTAVVEEIKFYLGQSMWNEASAATDRLSQLDPGSAAIVDFREQITAGLAAAAAPAAPPATPEVPFAEPVMEVAEAPADASVSEFSFESFSAEPEASAPASAIPEPAAPVVEAAPPPPPPAAPPVAAVATPAPVAKAAPPAPPAETDDLLGDLVSDLEDSLGDFVPAAPSSKAAAPAPPVPKSVPAPPSPAAAAAPPPVAAASAPTAPIAKAEETSALSDMFEEFKEDVEETADQAEDPETHYNLGIAFKEMGLLDEAIGELQKVCHAIEKGTPFSQPVQAFTWLAQCLVEKDVPQAAVRWYEKALKLPIDEDSRLAVYYDIGNAQEAAGNTKAAYAAFMECFSSNIDYRDVADRVKALKP